MGKKKPNQVRDEIDIKDRLDGPIADVIVALQALQAEYPDGKVEITTENHYGDYYAEAHLTFCRDQTPIEAERDAWDAKARELDVMRREAVAFRNNGTPYPRAGEMEALRKELGFFAMAPMRGSLTIYDDEVLVRDMTRGFRRRDGTFVLKMLMGSSEQLDKLYEAEDEQYRV